jgi:hypothetical protein
VLDQSLGERAFPRARGTRDADAPGPGAAGERVRVRQHALEPVALILDQGDRPRERRRLAPAESLEDLLHAHVK